MSRKPWLLAALFTITHSALAAPPPCMSEDDILDEAALIFPSRYDTLLDLSEADSPRYPRLLHTTAHQLDNPDLIAALERQTAAEEKLAALGATWATATPTQRNQMAPDLASAAGSVVDAQQAIRRARQAELRASLDAMNAEIRDADMNRAALISDEVARVTH